jgi:cob(I)alamin adenosyltransferase
MSPADAMNRLDTLLSHVWMVRAFVKHSEEAEEDEELAEVHRTLYDYMLALGGPLKENDAVAYLKQANKKFKKLQRATEQFVEIQPEISNHTNFQMAVRSLTAAVKEICEVLEAARRGVEGSKSQEIEDSDA